jgi:hypothetical protein
VARAMSYTEKEDGYLRQNYTSKTHQELGDAIGRTKDSVKLRLRQLRLYKLKPQSVNKNGIHRDGYKYTLFSDWKTRLDTPCPLLLPCPKCEQLKPVIDFYILKGSGNKDILGNTRTRVCPKCNTKEYQEKDPRDKLLYNAKQRANQDGKECTIRKDDIIISKLCPILGIPLISKEGKGRLLGKENPNSPELDRIDNSEGYVARNICVISSKANVQKRDGNLNEFMAILGYLIESELGIFRPGENHVPYANRSFDQLVDCIINYIERNEIGDSPGKK